MDESNHRNPEGAKAEEGREEVRMKPFKGIQREEPEMEIWRRPGRKEL